MLGSLRAPHDTLEPLLVTLTERTDVFPLYQHAGTELIFMISGKMEYICGSTRYLLEPGDALQFVGEAMHGPGALMSLPIQFLAIKSVQPGRVCQLPVYAAVPFPISAAFVHSAS